MSVTRRGSVQLEPEAGRLSASSFLRSQRSAAPMGAGVGVRQGAEAGAEEAVHADPLPGEDSNVNANHAESLRRRETRKLAGEALGTFASNSMAQVHAKVTTPAVVLEPLDIIDRVGEGTLNVAIPMKRGHE